MLKRNVLTKVVVVTFNSNVLLKMAYKYEVIEVVRWVQLCKCSFGVSESIFTGKDGELMRQFLKS